MSNTSFPTPTAIILSTASQFSSVSRVSRGKILPSRPSIDQRTRISFYRNEVSAGVGWDGMGRTMVSLVSLFRYLCMNSAQLGEESRGSAMAIFRSSRSWPGFTRMTVWF